LHVHTHAHTHTFAHTHTSRLLRHIMPVLREAVVSLNTGTRPHHNRHSLTPYLLPSNITTLLL
jgi:hypothetical protein